MIELYFGISAEWLIYLIVVAFITSMIHGATGIAGGFLLAAAAAPVIGVKTLIPVLSVALLVSHASRALFNRESFSYEAYWNVVIPAAPCIIIAALLYGRLSSPVIAFLLATVILCSVPLRRWAARQKITTTHSGLRSGGAVYGAISGVSVGPGMLLVPLLLGFGLTREQFVATVAGIAFTTNIIRGGVYGFTNLLDTSLLLLALMLGCATIPGAWVGRSVLRSMTDGKHAAAVEMLVILGAANLYWIGFRSLNAAV